jgi:hypothetical protein
MFFDLMCVAPFLDGSPDSMARRHHAREIAASYRPVAADDTPDRFSSTRGHQCQLDIVELQRKGGADNLGSIHLEGASLGVVLDLLLEWKRGPASPWATP